MLKNVLKPRTYIHDFTVSYWKCYWSNFSWAEFNTLVYSKSTYCLLSMYIYIVTIMCSKCWPMIWPHKQIFFQFLQLNTIMVQLRIGFHFPLTINCTWTIQYKLTLWRNKYFNPVYAQSKHFLKKELWHLYGPCLPTDRAQFCNFLTEMSCFVVHNHNE